MTLLMTMLFLRSVTAIYALSISNLHKLSSVILMLTIVLYNYAINVNQWMKGGLNYLTIQQI